MNISRENIDNLNAILSIKLEKEDYESRVTNVLNDYRRKVNLDGFRPGKVPFGLIKKMYRKPALIEEINKLISESISKYLLEEKLNILGEPLPHIDDNNLINWDVDEVFDFKFDLGLAPEIEVKISSKDKYPLYLIKVDNALIDKYIENYKERFGEFESVDTPDEKDVVNAEIQQLDSNDELLADGIHVEEAKLSIELIKDDTIKKKVLSVRKGDSLIIDLKKAYPSDAELAGILKIEHKNVSTVEGNFQITIKEISRFRNAEINKELFEKVYGPGTINSEDEFRKKVAEDAKVHLRQDSEYRFRSDVKELLLNKIKMTLPKEFLKRWLVTINEGKFSEEQIDKEFVQFEADLKWQLIKDKIVEDNNLKISDDDLKLVAKDVARMQFSQYGMNNVPDEHLAQFAQRILEKEEDRNNIKSRTVENKVIELIRSTVKIDEKEISSDKFNKLFEK